MCDLLAHDRLLLGANILLDILHVLLGAPLIVLLIGLAAGIVAHLVWRRFWVASSVATIVASLLWVGSGYALFMFTAPSELGLPAFLPVVYTIVTALAGALIAGGAVRAIRPRQPESNL